jgi:hypothetical protein
MAINSFSNGNFINSLQAAGKNGLYNSGFDIAQRGTSLTGLAGPDYTLDRWMFWSTSGGQSNYASQQSAGNLSVSPTQAIRYCGRFGRTSGTTNTGNRVLAQTLETNDSVRFAGQVVTLSFYARAGANYSAASNALSFALTQGTGTDQIFYSFTGSSSAISGTATLTTSWQRFTATGTVATNATELSPNFTFIPTGTASTDDYFEITGVQLELGTTATTFSRNGTTIQGELAACQRYYFRYTGGNGSRFAIGNVESTTQTQVPFFLPTEMRTQPSLSFTSVGVRYAGTSDVTISTVGSGAYTVNMRVPLITVSSAVLTVGQAVILRGNAAPSIIEFNSEL